MVATRADIFFECRNLPPSNLIASCALAFLLSLILSSQTEEPDHTDEWHWIKALSSVGIADACIDKRGNKDKSVSEKNKSALLCEPRIESRFLPRSRIYLVHTIVAVSVVPIVARFGCSDNRRLGCSNRVSENSGARIESGWLPQIEGKEAIVYIF
jgi:hypothetical protein